MSGNPDDAVAERLRASLGRLIRTVYNRRLLPAHALPDWERQGWARTGAVEPGPLGTELYEVTREDTDSDGN